MRSFTSDGAKTQMADEQPAAVEYLDDPAVADRRRLPRPELLLAALLLAGIVLFGGLDWWRGQQELVNYRAGEQAAAAHDWGEASRRFRAAGGYGNASQLAQEADNNIAERDNQYALAEAAATSGDWLPALAASRRVDEIQPGFKESKALAALAESGVYSDTLQGVVVSRPQADPPGLYYRSTDSWRLLPGSNANSKVFYSRSDNRVVYSALGSNTAAASGRGAFPLTLTFADLAQNPSRFTTIGEAESNGTFATVGDNLVWIANVKDNCAQRHFSGIGCRELTTWYPQHEQSVILQLATPTWGVLDLSPASNSVLLADYGADDIDHVSSLYVAGPGGENPQRLYSERGQIQWAQFSPNGRYVLLIMGFRESVYGVTKKALVLDTRGGPPRQVARVAYGSPGTTVGLDFVRLPEDPQHRILLADYRSDRTTISLVNHDGSTMQVLWTERGANLPTLTASAAGGYIVLCPNGSVSTPTPAAANHCVLINRDNNVSAVHELIGPTQSVAVAEVRDNKLILVSSTQLDLHITSYLIGSWSLAALASGIDTQPELLRLDEAPGATEFGFSFGDHAFAYTVKEQLHARSYDGAIDLVLDPGVSVVYQ